MIPIYRTSRPELAVNLLLRNFRHVLIDCAYMNVHRGLDRRVRFRADDVTAGMVYFAKVPSQVKRWRERGGAIICWRWRNDLESDAILFAECPKRMEAFPTAIANTRVLAVVNVPVTWRPFEEIIEVRHADHPHKKRRALRSLAIIRNYVEERPILTRQAVRNLLRARSAPSQSSSSPSPVLPAGEAHSPNRTC